MNKYLAIVAFMLAAAFPAAFAVEPTQGKAGQQTTNASAVGCRNGGRRWFLMIPNQFDVYLPVVGCLTVNVPHQVLDFLHHQLQPQHHDHHHHH